MTPIFRKEMEEAEENFQNSSIVYFEHFSRKILANIIRFQSIIAIKKADLIMG